MTPKGAIREYDFFNDSDPYNWAAVLSLSLSLSLSRSVSIFGGL